MSYISHQALLLQSGLLYVATTDRRDDGRCTVSRNEPVAQQFICLSAGRAACRRKLKAPCWSSLARTDPPALSAGNSAGSFAKNKQKKKRETLISHKNCSISTSFREVHTAYILHTCRTDQDRYIYIYAWLFVNGVSTAGLYFRWTCRCRRFV